MDVAAMLIKFRLRLVLSVVSCVLILGLIYKAPTLLAYFSPLLLSTALFLVTVFVFGHTSPYAAESVGIKAGEGLLEYVASRTEEFECYISPPQAEEELQHPHVEVDNSHESE